MFAIPALLFLGSFISCRTAAYGSWPRPGSLIGFWPFDAQTGPSDIANSNNLLGFYGQLVTDINGPFGQPRTSYTVSCDCQLGYQDLAGPPPGFTVSFYFYSRSQTRSAIFMFCCGYLSINYAPPNQLEVWGPSSSALIAQFPIFVASSWNFFAVSYSKESGRLKVYDQNGQPIGSAYTMNINTTWPRIYVGHTYANGAITMHKTDAIACLMYYQAVLLPSEIAQLPEVCRTKGSTTSTTTTTTKIPTTTLSTTTTTTAAITTTNPPIKVTPWPRPGSLLGFWPLDSQYNLRDVSPNSFNGDQLTSPHSMTTGPYGDPNTAVKPQTDNSQVLTVANPKLAINGSFTITLFFSLGTGIKGKEGGLFEFLDTFGTRNALQFRYENQTTIEVSASNEIIGHYTMIQQKSAWTFVAFVFDSSNKMLTVYGRHGIVSPPTFQPEVKASNTFNNNGIRLGFATRWNQGLDTTDKVACLMVYSVPLTAAEIRQAHDSCRILHNSASCGSNKLAFSPIPAPTSSTTIPKPGQFPYIAVVRFGTASVCSASIIDEYWLVTSVACFQETKNASLYMVYVGKHDLGLTEAHSRAHQCSRIIVSGNSARDVALIQLTDPIDFRNEYVNNVCLYRDENQGEIVSDATQFVFGWGKNGRTPLVSQTLPRYVPGKMLTNDQCTQVWGSGNYTAGRDFCFMSASSDKNVPCFGDEGSPLLVQALGNSKLGTSDRLIQLGVYYKRDSNCTPLKPGLFANVAEYNGWISETLACAVPGVIYPDRCPQI